MKTIILVRHAKSSWDNPQMSDFDRTLNDRGVRDADKMSQKIFGLFGKTDIIFSSPAERAISTARVFADAMGIDHENIIKDFQIYENGYKQIIKIILGLDNQINSAIFFGHNPDITSLSTFYSGQYFEQVPTCSVICLDFDCHNWSDINKINAKIRFFEYPKK